ncbi:hypothetical protein [Orientia tsutsugamushi]|nr:hypothetical protein [Orientia tsutsugamushi]
MAYYVPISYVRAIPYTIACMELVRQYMSKATRIIRECAENYNIYNTI